MTLGYSTNTGRITAKLVCFGCGTPLIVEALPYQVRAMSQKELLELDPETRAMIERAQAKILLKKRV